MTPTAMSLDETRKLAEYLAGSAATPGGALRAAAEGASRGRRPSAPFTSSWATKHGTGIFAANRSRTP